MLKGAMIMKDGRRPRQGCNEEYDDLCSIAISWIYFGLRSLLYMGIPEVVLIFQSLDSG